MLSYNKRTKHIIEKIERESYQNRMVIRLVNNNYYNELDPDCLRYSSHS